MTGKRFTIGDRALQELYGGCIPAILDGGIPCSQSQVLKLLNELHEEVMDLRRENTKFKLIVSEIIEDMQKYIDDNQLVYINQSYVDWIKKEVDTTLYSQKRRKRDYTSMRLYDNKTEKEIGKE